MSQRPRGTSKTHISAGLAAVALAIFLLVQWNHGGLPTWLMPAASSAVATAQQPATRQKIGAPATATKRASATHTSTPRTATQQAAATPTVSRRVTSAATTKSSQTTQSGLAAVALRALPPEAQHTVQLIDQGGPFPYTKDGTVFQNREGILPKQPTGYYHEYTVITSGSPDRGARRVIAGKNGELYYTDDHYTTFREVLR